MIFDKLLKSLTQVWLVIFNVQNSDCVWILFTSQYTWQYWILEVLQYREKETILWYWHLVVTLPDALAGFVCLVFFSHHRWYLFIYIAKMLMRQKQVGGCTMLSPRIYYFSFHFITFRVSLLGDPGSFLHVIFHELKLMTFKPPVEMVKYVFNASKRDMTPHFLLHILNFQHPNSTVKHK